jgi:hypothetical protein
MRDPSLSSTRDGYSTAGMPLKLNHRTCDIARISLHPICTGFAQQAHRSRHRGSTAAAHPVGLKQDGMHRHDGV